MLKDNDVPEETAVPKVIIKLFSEGTAVAPGFPVTELATPLRS